MVSQKRSFRNASAPSKTHPMFFLTPKYLKHGKLLLKGVTRFLNYKRDILPPKKLEEILSLRDQLVRAIKEKDADRIEKLTDTINTTCDRALPDARMSAIAENVEVFFVSIVIAMGIRTYIAQPFKIPTGSMQPTLNGIIATRTENDPTPGFGERVKGWVTGTSYINAYCDRDGELRENDPITEHSFFLFFQYCLLHFKDGSTLRIDAPFRQLTDPVPYGFDLAKNIGMRVQKSGHTTEDGHPSYELAGGNVQLHKGQLLARGILTGGDQVIVNKFAYHFRQPTRGEVFVFTTKNIDYIWDGMTPFDRAGGSQAYIKRLGGVPGDTLDVHSPELIINGKVATEPGFQRVMSQKNGYEGYSPHKNIELPITLSTGPNRQYFALGDNSYNSSDSRYWGPVPEKNLIGPGWFCYWPLTSHWGVIR